MSTEVQQDKPETLGEATARYDEAYTRREAGILHFLDEEGELKKDASREAFDDHCNEAWSDSHGDLGSLLGELKPFLAAKHQIADLVAQYRDNEARRDGRLDVYRDEDGDVETHNYPRYDEMRFDNAVDAQDDLNRLLDALDKLLP